MENVIDDLNYRGLIEQYSNEDNVRKLLSEKQTIYCGFDPSASSMHLGNFVMISTLMRLQRAGHRIIAVVGGATGMIGDPSGKSKERNLQNEDVLKANTESIKNQLERFLDLSDPEKGLIVNNYDWLGSMTTLDFLREYGKYFSINYMLSKEIVASRLEAGISFTEFSYQILQSIDFLTLYRKYGCKMQIGGNDQWGNLTSGLELIRKLEGDTAPCEVMTAHLLLRSDGKKFGKSEQGALFLNPDLTSPYQLYQYFINCTDEDAVKYLKVLTFLPKEEIEDIALEPSPNPVNASPRRNSPMKSQAKSMGKRRRKKRLRCPALSLAAMSPAFPRKRLLNSWAPSSSSWMARRTWLIFWLPLERPQARLRPVPSSNKTASRSMVRKPPIPIRSMAKTMPSSANT